MTTEIDALSVPVLLYKLPPEAKPGDGIQVPEISHTKVSFAGIDNTGQLDGNLFEAKGELITELPHITVEHWLRSLVNVALQCIAIIRNNTKQILIAYKVNETYAIARYDDNEKEGNKLVYDVPARACDVKDIKNLKQMMVTRGISHSGFRWVSGSRPDLFVYSSNKYTQEELYVYMTLKCYEQCLIKNPAGFYAIVSKNDGLGFAFTVREETT